MPDSAEPGKTLANATHTADIAPALTDYEQALFAHSSEQPTTISNIEFPGLGAERNTARVMLKMISGTTQSPSLTLQSSMWPTR